VEADPRRQPGPDRPHDLQALHRPRDALREDGACARHDPRQREYLPPALREHAARDRAHEPGLLQADGDGRVGRDRRQALQVLGPQQHVVDRVFDIPDGWEIYEGWDYGWANPTVQLTAAIDFTGRIWVVSEYRAIETPSRASPSTRRTIRRAYYPGAARSRPRSGRSSATSTPFAAWMDPSAWAKRGEHAAPADEFLEHEIYVARANNERVGGWARLETWMTTRWTTAGRAPDLPDVRGAYQGDPEPADQARHRGRREGQRPLERRAPLHRDDAADDAARAGAGGGGHPRGGRQVDGQAARRRARERTL
jgi:hypothetical protein